ncbi:hypothetical protein CMK12_09945 [Candidatus Poribacteria bacterium]|nr:hypothetical protein [Candidatus Poribacteria bacterium]
MFNVAGSPVPRYAYVNITVHGQNSGIYTHVERIHRPLLKRAFGSDKGILYGRTVVDFYPGWSGSFERRYKVN